MTLPVSCFVDRSGTLDFGVKLGVLDPIPAVDPDFNLDFAALMCRRAREIILMDQPVTVMWSGGLDSTGALSALLDAGITDDQLHVVLTSNSIVEYPDFYHRFVQRLPNVTMMPPSLLKATKPVGLTVTGELGDQTFGSIIVRRYLPDYAQTLTRHWHDHVPHDLIEVYEPFVAAAPFEIRCIYDFLWWFNFSCKWQHVVMRVAQAADSVLDYMNDVVHFYRIDYFQQWSMNEHNHRTLKTGRTYNSYKLALRKYIEQFTGDSDYANYKQKIGSLPLKFNSRYLMVLSNGEKIRFGDRMCSDAAAYDAKYGDQFDHLFNKGVSQ